MTEGAARITQLLAEAQDGREEALDEVMELVYQDLRRIAGRQLARRYRAGSAVATLRSPRSWFTKAS